MENHSLEEPIRSLLTAKVHVFSDPVSAQVLGCWTILASKFGLEGSGSQSTDHCTNRIDIACQSIDIEWNVRPGGTSVQIPHKLHSYRELGTNLRVFQTGSFREHVQRHHWV